MWNALKRSDKFVVVEVGRVSDCEMLGKMYRAPRPPMLSDSNRRIIESNEPTLRVYQVWKGSNRFCLGGRLVFGPDAMSIFLKASLIVIPVILFCAFVTQRLINEFHPRIGNLIVATLSSHHMFFFFSSLHLGEILVLSLAILILWNQMLMAQVSLQIGSQFGAHNFPLTKDVVVNGIIVKVKYCQTCMLYAHQDVLIALYAITVLIVLIIIVLGWGNVFGRNYGFFFMFVSSTTMLCLYIFTFCWVNIKVTMNMDHCNLWKAFLKSLISGVLILYTFMTAWFVGGLTTFHLYLICTNQTTYENFRYHYNAKMNPYNLGCLGNIAEIFFSKIPSSKNNFRERVKGNSSSVFAKSMSLSHARSPEMLKTSFDIETGKRWAGANEDFEEIQSQIDMLVD